MRAFLEKSDIDYLDDFVYSSKYPLLDRGIDIVDFNGTNLNNLLKHNPTKEDILIGSVQACEEFFKFINITPPKYLGYPDSIKSYLKRNISDCKFSDLTYDRLPVFIKPKNEVKLFTGMLIPDSKSLDFVTTYYKEINSNTEIYTSEPIEILSEYRCFVHKSKLMGIQYYLGDFTIFPDVSVINSIITDYIDSPISYTLDIGVNNDGTFLIEVNDMWAIGSYGFDNKQYVQMTIDRFREIVTTYKL